MSPYTSWPPPRPQGRPWGRGGIAAAALLAPFAAFAAWIALCLVTVASPVLVPLLAGISVALTVLRPRRPSAGRRKNTVARSRPTRPRKPRHNPLTKGPKR